MTQNFPGMEPEQPLEPEYAGRVLIDRAYANRSTLTKATGFISDYDYTLNPYSGCAFGCQYCYATAFVSEKPNKDGSPSPYTRKDWGNWVRIKKNAVPDIQTALARGSLNGKSIYMSSVTDPYQPTERRTKQTNLILQELTKAQKLGLTIQTRGPRVNNAEDIALCKAIAANGGHVQVNMTITTNDEAVRRALEPTCPSYQQRLKAITAINEQVKDISGYTACITLSPLLPTAEPKVFAENLIASGIDRFIIQPVHTAAPTPGRFRAVTRNELVHQLAILWNYIQKDEELPPDRAAAVRRQYAAEYKKATEILLPALAKEIPQVKIGFGQPGFGRPWRREWHTDRSKAPPYGYP